MRFKTESGSTYEVEGGRIRRLNSDYTKRADGEWWRYFGISPWPVAVGHSVVIAMESLAELGPDDNGSVEPGSLTTVRTTSRVTEVWA